MVLLSFNFIYDSQNDNIYNSEIVNKCQRGYDYLLIKSCTYFLHWR